MKVLPKSITERRELNLRQGIKSSLSNIRSIVALVYVLYRSNNRKASVEYSESGNGGQIKLHSAIESNIKALLNIDDLSFINSNPLFKSQMEALQVGIELIFKLGKVEFINNTLASSAERTGGQRYEKRIRFGTNIQILDTFLSSYESDLPMFLNKWMNNQDSEKMNIDSGVKKLLTIFSEETQFKIRYNNQEISFQQEGIYKEFAEGNTVVGRDEHENVGPFRVFKSFIKEGLHPYILEENGDEFVAKISTADAVEYYQIVSNALDLIPRRTQITTFVLQNEVAKSTYTSIPDQKQIIYYGCPGTGKSHIIKKRIQGESVIRTTFHPDSDYSTFVGCYKPTTKKVEMRDVAGKVVMEQDNAVTEDRIIYEFIDQAFLQAYIKAWKFYAKTKEAEVPQNQYLIIEEINRGNCAQIFGDLFQLLDRNDYGFSDYYIHADKDMKKHLANAFKDLTVEKSNQDTINSMYPDDVVTKVFSGEILLLPNNLFIWATMNTSDQSLFPIDSAFKRRWDWEYVPINYGKDIASGKFTITIEDSETPTTYNWVDFLKIVNEKIYDATNSEDKQMGNFFIKKSINAREFVNKVMFYLWNEICKEEYGTQRNFFRKGVNGTTEFKFTELFDTDADQILNEFMLNLGVKSIDKTNGETAE